MITIHHLGISQSERIVWLCEELEVVYRLQCYERDPVTRAAPPEYKALSPMGIAPVIEDDGLVLGESGAIVEYIIAKHGQGRLSVDASRANFADYLFWYHFANGTFMPSEMGRIMAAMAGSQEGNPIIAMFRARSERCYAMVEQRLSEAQYFAGDQFTAADIMMLFPLTTMRNFAPLDLQAVPYTRAYLRRIGERPAYRTAMQKADPGLALQLS